MGAQLVTVSGLTSLRSRFYGLFLFFVGIVSIGVTMRDVDLKTFLSSLVAVYATTTLSVLTFGALSLRVDTYDWLVIYLYGAWLLGMVKYQKLNLLKVIWNVD
jgi:hypothetical protein